MSPLTKLFVVLLIVLSLLLAAGTVVFVNTTTDNKKLLDQTKAQLDTVRNELASAQNESQAAKSRLQETVGQMGGQIEQSKQMVSTLQQQGVQKDTQLAQVTAQQQLQGVENTTLAGALKASEETKSRLQDQVNDLRSNNDKLVAQNGQLNLTNTDLLNRLEVTERERRLLAEQLTEAKGQVDKQGSMLRDMGVSPAQLASAGTRVGAPPINGVIRQVKPIRGVLYGEISLGSADGVATGMEFKVINRENGKFLGFLKVDTVELNQSTGRLSGPNVNEIKQGADVKTQW